jgi:hypothetical protein
MAGAMTDTTYTATQAAAATHASQWAQDAPESDAQRAAVAAAEAIASLAATKIASEGAALVGARAATAATSEAAIVAEARVVAARLAAAKASPFRAPDQSLVELLRADTAMRKGKRVDEVAPARELPVPNPLATPALEKPQRFTRAAGPAEKGLWHASTAIGSEVSRAEKLMADITPESVDPYMAARNLALLAIAKELASINSFLASARPSR